MRGLLNGTCSIRGDQLSINEVT